MATKTKTKHPESALKRRIADVLRKEFPPPDDWVDISDGYANNIHIIVISSRFKALREPEKQELLWSVIDESDLKKSEKAKISLILPYSPVELK